MTSVHRYRLHGNWTGNHLSVGEFRTEGLQSEFSVPQNLGGPGRGTSPEELLLSAAAGCYLITLSILLSKRDVPYKRIELESSAFVEYDGGLRMDKIVHKPIIVLSQWMDDDYIRSLAHHAEHACMVSSAIRGNVLVLVDVQTLLEETPAPAPGTPSAIDLATSQETSGGSSSRHTSF